jgi:hypothetical protein
MIAAPVALVLVVGAAIAAFRLWEPAPRLTYEATRQFKDAEGEELSATITYDIKLQVADETQPVGEFVVRAASVSGFEDEVDEVIPRLINQPGLVPLNDVEAMDLGANWEILAELVREIGGQGQRPIEPDEGSSSRVLNVVVLLVIIEMEVQFDVRAMFATITGDSDVQDGFDLQSGEGELLSTIRIESPGTAAGGGQTRRYAVMRRGAGEEEFRRVGNIFFGSDGVLDSLHLRYQGGEGTGAFVYELNLKRL